MVARAQGGVHMGKLQLIMPQQRRSVICAGSVWLARMF